MSRRVAVRYSVAMAEHLVPWALLAAFLMGSVVGLSAAFYLLSKVPDRLHAAVIGDIRPVCAAAVLTDRDRVLCAASLPAARASLDRARLCGAHVCPDCLDILRRT